MGGYSLRINILNRKHVLNECLISPTNCICGVRKLGNRNMIEGLLLSLKILRDYHDAVWKYCTRSDNNMRINLLVNIILLMYQFDYYCISFSVRYFNFILFFIIVCYNSTTFDNWLMETEIRKNLKAIKLL